MSEWTIKNRAYKPEMSEEQIQNAIEGVVQQTNTKIVLNNGQLDTIDLNTEYYQRHVDDYVKQWFFLNSSKEHYRFLVYLVSLFSNQIITDIGTHKGGSAVALASNPNNQVYSFDIENQITVDLSDIPNIHLLEANVAEYPKYNPLILSSSIIFLDTSPHEGVFETSFYNILSNNNYKGILCLDDIHLGAGMESFWNNIKHRKYDITSYGHFSGTGIVVFNDTTEIILS